MSWLRAVGSHRAFLFASAVYFAHGAYLTGELPLWSEQTSTVVSPPFAVLDRGGRPDREDTLLPGCTTHEGLARSPVRPVAAICAFALSWPVLGSPYASSIPYWPLGILTWAGADATVVRTAGLVFGWLGLWVLYRLASIMSDRRRAIASVCVAAVSSPYVVLHGLMTYYEVVPSLLVASGTLVLASDPKPRHTHERVAVASLFFAFAVVANAKAVVLLAVLALVARVTGARASRTTIAMRAFSAGVFVAVLLPFVALARTDPYGGVSSQVSTRIATALAHLSPRFLVFELANVSVFSVDFAYYFGIAAGGAPRAPWLPAAIAAMTYVVGMREVWRALRGRPCDATVFGAMALITTYVVFVALVYQQTPAANYGPIVHAFAPALAIPWVGVADAVARRFGMDTRRVDIGLLALGMLGLFATTHARGRQGWHTIASIDLGAERSIASAISRAPDEPVLVTLIYNHAGVFDALARGMRPSLAVHRAIDGCPRGSDPAPCLDRVLDGLVCGGEAHDFVVPLGAARVDESFAPYLADALRRAADHCHADLITRAEGSALDVPALRLVRSVPSH